MWSSLQGDTIYQWNCGDCPLFCPSFPLLGKEGKILHLILIYPRMTGKITGLLLLVPTDLIPSEQGSALSCGSLWKVLALSSAYLFQSVLSWGWSGRIPTEGPGKCGRQFPVSSACIHALGKLCCCFSPLDENKTSEMPAVNFGKAGRWFCKWISTSWHLFVNILHAKLPGSGFKYLKVKLSKWK